MHLHRGEVCRPSPGPLGARARASPNKSRVSYVFKTSNLEKTFFFLQSTLEKLSSVNDATFRKILCSTLAKIH